MGRVGSHISQLDAIHASSPGQPAGQFRRIYMVPDGRLLVDLTGTGRVRQVTLGRERATNETWEAATGDWSLSYARTLAARWLPKDAALLRIEPFHFQERVAGTRDVYSSEALASVLAWDDYLAASAGGPVGVCGVTCYQTSDGGVAFLLVGIV